MIRSRSRSPLPEKDLKKFETSQVTRRADIYINPQAVPGKFNIAHLSGNWNRVACDFRRQFLEKYPSARVLELHDSSVPTYSVDMEAALKAMVRMGQIAKLAGCEVAAIACNTMHLHKNRFEEETGLKMLDMIQGVKDRVVSDFRSNQLVRVGVVGSLQTMASDLYSFESHNLQHVERGHCFEVFVPTEKHQEILNKLIVQHKKVTSPYMCFEFLTLLKSFAGDRCLDCIVLGCTDFATLLQESVVEKFSYDDIGLISGVENLKKLSIGTMAGSHDVYLYDSVQCLVDACGAHVCQYKNIHN